MAENIMARPREETEVKITNKLPVKDEQRVPFKSGELEVDKNIPVSLYEQRFHKPYAAEFFGMDKSFLLNLNPQAINQLREIDGFVLKQIGELDLKDNKKSYNTILNKLLTLLGVDENEKALSKMEKILNIIQIRKLFK